MKDAGHQEAGEKGKSHAAGAQALQPSVRHVGPLLDRDHKGPGRIRAPDVLADAQARRVVALPWVSCAPARSSPGETAGGSAHRPRRPRPRARSRRHTIAYCLLERVKGAYAEIDTERRPGRVVYRLRHFFGILQAFTRLTLVASFLCPSPSISIPRATRRWPPASSSFMSDTLPAAYSRNWFSGPIRKSSSGPPCIGRPKTGSPPQPAGPPSGWETAR